MISNLARRIREATWFFGAIAATIGGGVALYLLGVPAGWIWSNIAAALGGFFLCIWLFRSEIFWHLYISEDEEEIEWPDSPLGDRTYPEDLPTYEHAGDTIVRFMRQPTLEFPFSCGVKVLDGSDEEPLLSLSFDKAVGDAYRAWVMLGREYTVDVKICKRMEIRS